MMKKLMQTAAAVAFAVTLAACDSTSPPASEVAANDMNAMMVDPNNPYAASEMAMDQAMMAAVGVNPADSWVRKMIEHHKGAVEMSRIALTLNPTPDVAKMAQMTIDNQTREIADLQRLVANGTPDPTSGDLYRTVSTDMHRAMMAASGADSSETYLRKMLAHHQGAVAMSDVALANGASGAIRAQIKKTRSMQAKEVAMIEAMIRGEPMPGMTETPAAPAPSRPTEPQATAKPSATPPAAAPKAAAPAASAPAPKTADPTCLPEHRAAGHC